MKRRNLVIFDIDGVLFEPQHRIQDYIEGRFDEYFSKALTDEPIEQGLATCRMFLDSPDHYVLFVTGRGDHANHRKDTLEMLYTHLDRSFWPTQLLMREWPIPPEQAHPDSVVKPQMIEAAGWSLNNIFMVFEDKTSIVNMWRARGVIAYQTQELAL